MGSPAVLATSPRKSPSSLRRANKPLVEKKRRARINGCLGQLKSLILTAMNTEGSQVSRLEKADILEMTVKYLRHVQHQNSRLASTYTAPEATGAKYQAGYSECASEVIRYMDKVTGVTPDLRSRLEHHLVGRLRMTGTQHMGSSLPPTGVQALSGQSTNEERLQHYQTAVDLANMAALAMKANEARPTAVSSHCQSTYPPSNQMVASNGCQIVRNPANQNISTPQRYIQTMDTCTQRSPTMNTVVQPSIEAHVSQMSTSPSHDQRSQDILTPPSSTYSSSSSSPRPHSNSSDMDDNDLFHHHHQQRRRRYSSGDFSSNTVMDISDDNSDTNNNIDATTRDGNNNHIQTPHNNNSNPGSDQRPNNTTRLGNPCQDQFPPQPTPSKYNHPLHIQIPDSPPLSTSPSPPLLKANWQAEPPRPHHPPTAVEDSEGPPTILYGVDEYHMSAFGPHQPATISYPYPQSHPAYSQTESKQTTHVSPQHTRRQSLHQDNQTPRKTEVAVNGKTQSNCARELRSCTLTSNPQHPLTHPSQRTYHNGQGHPSTPSPPTLVKEEIPCDHRNSSLNTQEFAHQLPAVPPGFALARKLSGFPSTQRALNFQRDDDMNSTNTTDKLNAPSMRDPPSHKTLCYPTRGMNGKGQIPSNDTCHSYPSRYSSIRSANNTGESDPSAAPLAHPIPVHPVAVRCDNSASIYNNPSLHKALPPRPYQHTAASSTVTQSPSTLSAQPPSFQENYNRSPSGTGTGPGPHLNDARGTSHESGSRQSQQNVACSVALSHATLKKRHLFAQQKPTGSELDKSRPLGPQATRPTRQGPQFRQQQTTFLPSDLPFHPACSKDCAIETTQERLAPHRAPEVLLAPGRSATAQAQSVVSTDDKLWRPW